MGDSFGEFSQAWTRALLLLVVLIPFGVVSRSFRKIKRAHIGWIVFISLAGALNQAPYYIGFQHLPIGTATLLFYAMLTIGAFIFGKVLFHEHLTTIKLISLGLAIAGLAIIYQFTLSAAQLLPAVSTMAAGLMGAAAVVGSKKTSSIYSETQLLTSIFAAMFVCNLLLSVFLSESVPPMQPLQPWLAQLGYATAMLLANAAVIAGFKYVEPSIGGLLGLLEIVLAAILGVLLLGETVTPQLVLGSVVLLIAAGLPDLQRLFQTRQSPLGQST